MKLIQILIFGILLTACSVGTFASGNVNVSLSNTCIGQDSFSIELNYTKDCITDTVPQTLVVTVYSTCGDTIDVILTGQEFSIDLGYPNPCLHMYTCYGGWVPTQKFYIFSGNFSLPSPCSEWKVVYERSNRDLLQNANQAPLYVETINYGSCRSTAWVQPMSSIRVINQPTFALFSSINPDGDSLVYSLTSPKTDFQTSIQFNSGYSGSQPIPGITINPSTGTCNFTPTQIGEFVIGIKMEAYDKYTSALNSISLIDYTVWVIDSLNKDPKLSGILNLQGNATQVNSDTLHVDLGDSFSFEIEVTDADLLDSVTIFTNVTAVLPNATVSIMNGNPAKMNVGWKAPIIPNQTLTFNVTSVDDFCFASSIDAKNYTIIVGNGINSTPIITEELEMSIYPNPTTGILNLKNKNYEVVQIEIKDLLGKTIYKGSAVEGENSVDLSTYPSGMYVVQLHTAKKNLTRKILKN